MNRIFLPFISSPIFYIAAFQQLEFRLSNKQLIWSVHVIIVPMKKKKLKLRITTGTTFSIFNRTMHIIVSMVIILYFIPEIDRPRVVKIPGNFQSQSEVHQFCSLCSYNSILPTYYSITVWIILKRNLVSSSLSMNFYPKCKHTYRNQRFESKK